MNLNDFATNNTILGLVKLTRPVNCIAAVITVLLGAWLSGSPITMIVYLSSIVVVLILAASNVLNDCLDVEIDKLNKPNRPLPTGQVSLISAKYFSILLFISGFILSFFLKPVFVLGAFIYVGLGISYSFFFKSTVLVGNTIVAILAASVICYGGLHGTQTFEVAISASVIFFFMLAREILKLVEDYEGDNEKEVENFATRFGTHAAILLAIILFSIYLVLSPLPMVILSLSNWYFLPVVIINLKLVYIILKIHRKQTLAAVSMGVRLTKVDFFLWLGALVLGSAI